MAQHPSMAKITVYQFEYFDRSEGRRKVSEDYATEKAIREIGAVLLPETAIEVDQSQVGVHSGYLIGAFRGAVSARATGRSPHGTGC